MERRRLGRTGLSVSAVGLGTVELGLDYGIPSSPDSRRPGREEAARVLGRALELGINLIDTAPAYGESEARIGEALGGRRDAFLLATKVAAPGAGEGTGAALRRAVASSVQASLRALRTDWIDILQLHSASVEVVQRGEMRAAMADLQRSGAVRFVGATTYGEAAALAAIQDGGFDCVQVAYSALDRGPEERVLPLAAERDVGVIARSVLLKGALTHRAVLLPRSMDGLKSAAERLAEIAGSVDAVPALSYRYVLGHPAVATALVGTARLGELEAAVEVAARGSLSPDAIRAIHGITLAPGDAWQLDPSRWPAEEDAWR